MSPKEEQEAATYEEWRRACMALYGPSGQPPRLRELLSAQLLDDLKAWNDAHDDQIAQAEEVLSQEELEERGRELALRVRKELGSEDWEVLYHLNGRVHRVHPPGSWSAETWEQDLLGACEVHGRYMARLPFGRDRPRRRSVVSHFAEARDETMRRCRTGRMMISGLSAHHGFGS